MKVAAIGFNDYNEFDKVMQEFIAENDCLIFFYCLWRFGYRESN